MNRRLFWARLRSRLRAEFGEAAYRSWLKPASFEQADDETIRILAPTRFMRDWIETQYGDRLLRLWSEENPKIVRLDIVHAGADSDAPIAEPLPAVPVQTESPRAEIGAPLDPRFRFDNFVVGKPNELAFAAARRVAESESVPFNPLFLYGGVGLGKTHLMHAIAWQIRKTTPERRVIYLSAEKFMYQFIRAMRFKDTMAFKEQFRSVDVLMIDDVQFFSGKDNTQEEFFHTFNALVDHNRQVIISADKSPNDLEGMEERMKSRLGWGLVADIHPTIYELRLGILQSKAEKMEFGIPLKVAGVPGAQDYVECSGAGGCSESSGCLCPADRATDRPRQQRRRFCRTSCGRMTERSRSRKFKKRVAEHYNIRLGEMYSARRSRAIARPRQVAMYLSKQLTERSLPEIGRKFWWSRPYDGHACGAQDR